MVFTDLVTSCGSDNLAHLHVALTMIKMHHQEVHGL